MDINNQRISEHNGTLLIRKATIQDGGKYVCIVNNTNGQERAETELLIRGKNCVIHSCFRIDLRFLINILWYTFSWWNIVVLSGHESFEITVKWTYYIYFYFVYNVCTFKIVIMLVR